MQAFFINITKVSLTVSLVIALLLLLMPLIHRNYTVKWRYWIWLILALRLLIPFNISLPQTQAEIIPYLNNMDIERPLQSVSFVHQENNQIDAWQDTEVLSEATHKNIEWEEIILAVWTTGAVIFILYYMIGYIVFKRSVLRFSRFIGDKRAIEIFEEVKSEMKIIRNVGLFTSKKIKSPMMSGFLRPFICLPNLDYGYEELKIILKHELIHYKRKDIWYKLVFVCANAVHWFNPMVYLLRGISNRDLEMACDYELIKHSDTVFRKRYSQTILSAVQNENKHQSAFSTYFYGGKKTMKERLENILDMNKKRRGIITLCAIIIIVMVTGGSLSYGVSNDSNEKQGAIDNIDLINSNEYYIDNDKIIISYGNKNNVVVPLEVGKDIKLLNYEDKNSYLEEKDIYISSTVTAVAYGGYNDMPVSVLISNDEGESWSSYEVTDIVNNDNIQKYIGFTTKNEGWLLIAGDVAMGHEENRIFQTSDGGKTWEEIGNTNEIYSRVVTGVGFANKKIGFVSFRYDTDINPIVYRTEDRGKTWEKCYLEISESFKSITRYATPLSAVFNGSKGILPVIFHINDMNGNFTDVMVQYETSDWGRTWTFNEKYNLAHIWAEAWCTRDGKMRYDIMSEKMQEDFRSQQFSPDNFVIRWSSPWVVSYDIALKKENAVITYYYTDSTGSLYKGVECITFSKENGRIVVTNCKTQIDMEEYSDTSDWKSLDMGLYTFSMPIEWLATALDNQSVSFTHVSCDEQQIGNLKILPYNSSKSISQFNGKNTEIINIEKLKGYKYSAVKVKIKYMNTDNLKDTSYLFDTCIYLIPKNSEYAYALCYDSSWGDKRMEEIAKSITVKR
ncbi:M56 family metallopeptidase [Anaerovorax odorimutans]|uniref:M56 family metallopeptidase n=1 Tax=Anaerovorax odorimutans TaxID=109327 RepID=UPI000408C817|nr:M56 family metallopeptidase [Anaerovorax odorimutans]